MKVVQRGNPEIQGYMDYLLAFAHLASAILKTRSALNRGMLNAAASLWFVPRHVIYIVKYSFL